MSSQTKTATRKSKCELDDALLKAKTQCGYDNEEEGGFIITNGAEYKFVKVRNANTGKAVAAVLYDADEKEFGSKVLGDSKFTLFASFHTHPGTSVTPSSTDLQNLFTSFPRNYIYSPLANTLALYTLIPRYEQAFVAFDEQKQPLADKIWVKQSLT